ncbi:MAG: hypothetical protein IPJ32_04900 [Sphingobacteriaceae bacterium]|nr:hypothetical protein [Sphingobacteriaceae bacterium]
MELKIRIYKAIDNLLACERFAKGHENVLLDYGIKKVTSSNTGWFNDPDVFIVMVESVSGDELFGGARLHIKNREHLLPIENAISALDKNIHKLINPDVAYKTGELCGLWNTKSISGNGLSAMLVRTGVAKAGIFIAEKYSLKSLYTLSAPWTIGMVKKIGFVVEESVGNKGEFAYPKPDLIATVLVLNDILTLKNAIPEEKKDIFNLRENPVQRRIENGPKGT